MQSFRCERTAGYMGLLGFGFVVNALMLYVEMERETSCPSTQLPTKQGCLSRQPGAGSERQPVSGACTENWGKGPERVSQPSIADLVGRSGRSFSKSSQERDLGGDGTECPGDGSVGDVLGQR